MLGGDDLLLLNSIGTQPALGFSTPILLALGVSVVGVLLIVLLGLVVKAMGQVKAGGPVMALDDTQNQRTQEAILRLLDEMSALADGDLTTEATVSEDVTGAIADSVNYTIEALRDLVATIREGSYQLNDATRGTVDTTRALNKASQTQVQQIGAANEAIRKMLLTSEEMSEAANKTVRVAGHSVEVAHNGAEAVRRTIQGMDSIREQIQETSKRIKRLGESSQEIGNIIELINDIAEQTNTLALNASIQAAMAGEAGRGFAVVADEVQRLAERTGNATKQVEVLVRTIQADTNEAVISMERSTSGVVSGASLAVNAGDALEEIEKVSSEIAELVKGISSSSNDQTTKASGVSKVMGSIRQITEQTARGTQSTNEAVSRLAALAEQLRESVSGFRLPEDVQNQQQVNTAQTHDQSAPFVELES